MLPSSYSVPGSIGRHQTATSNALLYAASFTVSVSTVMHVSRHYSDLCFTVLSFGDQIKMGAETRGNETISNTLTQMVKYNIQMDLQEILWGVDWIDLAQ